jgi:RHH-type rel operon transcriptional repressor/antitoxin RelB
MWYNATHMNTYEHTSEQGMTNTVTFSVRLPTVRKEQLEALARSTGRSANYLANEAIASYVEANAWQIEETRRAVEKADAGGPFVPHEALAAWLEGWGTDEELPPPSATVTR